MTGRFLTIARLRRDASARSMIRALSLDDPKRAMDTHHQLVWSLFANDERKNAARDFLWRVDGDRFVILSNEVPNDAHSLFDLDMQPFKPVVVENDRRVFRLRANATVCRTENIDGSRRQHRHDVVMDTTRRMQEENPELKRAEARDLATPRAAEEWLSRIGRSSGFELETLAATSYRAVDLGRGRKKHARFGVLEIDGVLRVLEPKQLISRIEQGFGRAKAFGCGLMLLRT